jgi:predicted DNA-binding transcriptional regulator AlpA
MAKMSSAVVKKLARKRKRKKKKGAVLHAVDLASVRNRLAHRVGFLDKREVLAVVGCTYPALWGWQLAGTFPRARIVLGKSKWFADVIADWMDERPVRRLKGDPPPDQKIEETEVA